MIQRATFEGEEVNQIDVVFEKGRTKKGGNNSNSTDDVTKEKKPREVKRLRIFMFVYYCVLLVVVFMSDTHKRRVYSFKYEEERCYSFYVL